MNIKPLFPIVTTVMAMSLPGFAQDLQKPTAKWESHIEAEGKLGNNRDLGEANLFMPIWQNEDSLLFTDIRGRIDNADSEELNLGLGFRQIINNNLILGGYGLYDRRKTGNENVYNQDTLTAEALTANFEARVNAYIPESGEQDIGAGSAVGSINGGNIQVQNFSAPSERALPGVDIEVGAKLNLAPNLELWSYGGGYYFDADGFEKVAGPRGRLEMTYNNVPYLGAGSKFTVGLEAQHDDVRGGQQFAIARLRVPFSSFNGNKAQTSRYASLSPIEKRATTRIYRDVDIVSGEKEGGKLIGTEAATVTLASGASVSAITTIDASTANLVTDVAAAGANSLVVIDGSGGAINTGRVTVQNGQAIVGGGTSLTAATAGGKTVSFNVPGSRPTINANALATSDAFFIDNTSNNTRLENLTIAGNRTGIFINEGSNTTIRNVSVSAGSEYGIVVFGAAANQILIENSQVTSSGLSGIDVLSSARATLNNVEISNAGTEGLFVRANARVTANNIQITDSTGDGIRMSASSGGRPILEINNSTITNAGGDAFDGFEANVSGGGNVINGTVGGVACSASSIIGSVAFTNILGGGAGTCP